MIIPRIGVVVTHQGRAFPLRGSIDTGYDGLAIVAPEAARRMGLRAVGEQELVGFGGRQRVPVVRADALALEGAPECSLTGVDAAATGIPGGEEVLLGEEFFRKFAFDLKYEGGQLAVACARRTILATFEWMLPPALVVGGFFVLGLVVGEALAPAAARRRAV